MRILLIGSGAREHTILQSLLKTKQDLTVFIFGKTLNPGMLKLVGQENFYIGDIEDLAKNKEIAVLCKPDFVVIGPDNPIGIGVADAMLELGIKSFGPLKTLAQLESSKSFTRNLLEKYNIEGNPKYRTFTKEDESEIESYILNTLHGEYVVKFDGLFGGKGVKVSGEHLTSIKQGVEFALECIKDGGKVVIEEKFIGPEFSLISFTDGKTLAPTPIIQDHKRAFNGDLGPNTGGMGTYSDSNHLLPFITNEDKLSALQITKKVLDALYQETNQHYIGVMYGGFIKTKDGIKLIEFNARFGDPEAMNILNLLDSDLVEIISDCIQNKLDPTKVKFKNEASVCIYVVPKGYPDQPLNQEEKQIVLDKKVFDIQNLHVAFASVDLVNETENSFVLNLTSSRAIAFTATAETIEEARKIAVSAVNYVSGSISYRTDIGTFNLIQKRIDLVNSFNQ